MSLLTDFFIYYLKSNEDLDFVKKQLKDKLIDLIDIRLKALTREVENTIQK